MQSLVNSSMPDETDAKLPVDLCLLLSGFKDFLP